MEDLKVIGMLVRLWIWCVNNADQDGQIRYASREDLEAVLMVGRRKRTKIHAVLDALIDCGWIENTDGRWYIHYTK